MDYLTEGTNREYEEMLKAGCTPYSWAELLNAISALGYALDRTLGFVYNNMSNKNKYRAKSIGIIEADTKLHFSHLEARRDENYKRLQELRVDAVCIYGGRIVEL